MLSSTPPRRAPGAPRRPSARRVTIRRRNRNRYLAIFSVIMVVAVVTVLIVVKVLAASPAASSRTSKASAPASPAIVHSVTTVPLAQLLAAARSTHTASPSALHGPLLTVDGKPEVLYIGAEFCPFCAAERWAVVTALSQFGTWSGLRVTYSSATDSYPDTPTLSFRSATFTSKYLVFRSVEETTNQPCRVGVQGCSSNGYQLLQQPTSAEEQLLETVDSAGSIPFVDLGGIAVLTGAAYDPQVLAGQTPAEVAARLGEPHTTDAKQIGSAAAALTKSVCQMTGEQPHAVCSLDAT